MVTEHIHKNGELFDMICDHICPTFIRRDEITQMLARANGIDGEWVLVYTKSGGTLLIEENDLRKYRLDQLINKIKTNG